MIELREYQKDIAAKGLQILQEHKLLYLAMQVRTGKTLTALHTADLYGAKSVLVLTKKKAIGSIQTDYNSLSHSFRMTVTNYEQISKLNPLEYDFIIVDEAQNFGTYPTPSKRFLDARKLCAGKPLILLSGTPSPESYSMLFHELMLSSFSPMNKYLSPKHGFRYSFYRFATDYVTVKEKRFGAGQPIKDYKDCNGDKLWPVIKHLFIMFTQEEAGFTAPVEEFFLEVEMSDDAKKVYKELDKQDVHIRIQPNGRELIATVNSGADKVNKLAQISSGTLIFDDHPKGIIIDWTKANFIRNYFFGKKIAIYYRFKAEFELLQKFFPDWTESPEDFNANPHLAFLGQVQSAREGVNLSTADALVAYNIDFSATSYFQMRARIQSKERKGSAPLYWIFSKHGIERKVYQAVSNKINFTHSYFRNSYAGKTPAIQNKKVA